VHLIPRPASRDPRRHRFDAAIAAVISDCRARNLSPATTEFYLEGLTGYGAFARGEERDLTLADLDLGIARGRLAGSAEPLGRPPRGP
jgi:hypothetical protein